MVSRRQQRRRYLRSKVDSEQDEVERNSKSAFKGTFGGLKKEA